MRNVWHSAVQYSNKQKIFKSIFDWRKGGRGGNLWQTTTRLRRGKEKEEEVEIYGNQQQD